MNEALRADVEELIRKLEDAQGRLTPRIKEGFDLGQRLREEAKRIGEAASDSWIGYHSRMYYGDLTAPPPPERSWDADWGGIYGIPDGWKDWSVQEIQQLVEERAGLTLRELAAVADEVREECQPLQREALTVLSPASDLVGGDRERALLEKIEGLTWIISPDNLVRAIAPNHMLTRDMQAMSQGLQAPSHIAVETGIASNTSTLATCRDFLLDALQAAKQMRTKLAQPVQVARQESGGAPDAALAGYRRRARVLGLVLLLLLVTALAAGTIFVLQRILEHRLAAAAVIVGAGAIAALLYALLVDREHARRAAGVAIAVGGAIAVVDQLLGHFYD
jgi:hypothetical protein